jgi:chromosome segregation ATPase
MKTGNWLAILMVLCVGSLILLGCSSKSEGPQAGSVDESKPVSQVKTEAESMNVEQLRAIALKYKAAIQAKEPEIKKITDQIKQIPIAEALGKEATALKADLEELNKSIAALKEHFQVYVSKLKELKGDLTGLEL